LFPDIYPSTIKREDISDIPVVIKISSIKYNPNMKTKNLIALAGWNYQDASKKKNYFEKERNRRKNYSKTFLGQKRKLLKLKKSGRNHLIKLKLTKI